MPWICCLLAVGFLAALMPQARADLVGLPAGAPRFDAQDQEIIARNATLRELQQTQPWILRQVLDALAKLPPRSDDSASQGSSDPDLDRLRSSPEGLHDLFQ